MKMLRHRNVVISFLAVLVILLSSTGCTQKRTTSDSTTTSPEETLAFFGDSITAGLLPGGQHAQKSYPWWVGKSLNVRIKNYGRDGGKNTGDSDRDLLSALKTHNLKGVHTVVLAYGINDYSDNAELNTVTAKLLAAIQYIQRTYPKVKILGVLPQNAFIVPVPAANTAGDAMQTKNKANYTESELCDNLAAVYKKSNVPTLDWRPDSVINANNVDQLTWDGVLHPNKKGYHIIGLRVAAFILQNGGA
ncbi:SGNH/GDSL hydrolase family protein [Levilactobacillus fujinensis]|uniref:SGNH/GDSL hydrolase family protein n=1 Tax=Levilactobacillus fujinensis TaxID=2486024 RepID=A0ABW1TG95_9LACO|nr:SGNH/GDSL hydrolase family protein [Levilactobacillus fujinensis]